MEDLRRHAMDERADLLALLEQLTPEQAAEEWRRRGHTVTTAVPANAGKKSQKK